MRDRVEGVLLFLPVPAVLFLFTQAPIGSFASLLLGLAVMATHRLYARPFALARADRRCLWCGGAAEGPELPVEEPLGSTRWRACGEGHARAARRFLGWAGARAPFVKAGILGALALYVVLGLVAVLRPSGAVRFDDAVNLFRAGVAMTVLPLSLLGPRGPDSSRPRAPFPVHIQALIGTAAVLWLFRVVGLAWLLLAIRYVAAR